MQKTQLEKIEWMGYQWRMQEHWGQVHPKNNWQWYSPDCVRIMADGSLELYTKYQPKKFMVYDPAIKKQIEVFPHTGVGLISSVQEFHFGYYKIVAKLPSGLWLWPAIWGWGGVNWLREFDILEGYSNKNGTYFRWGWPLWKIWKLQSNFHYKDQNGVQSMAGAENMFVGFRNPAKRFITYEMEWTPEFIKLYVDGHLRRTLQGEAMQYFQEPVNFLINNGTRRQHPISAPASVFTIKSFTHDSRI